VEGSWAGAEAGGVGSASMPFDAVRAWSAEMCLASEPENAAGIYLDRQTPPVIFCRHTSQPVADAGSTERGL